MKTYLTLTVLVSIAARCAAQCATVDPSGAANVGNGKDQQFIGGQCTSDADCGSACCVGLDTTGPPVTVGICSSSDTATQSCKVGCGFSN
jgi:hypothetical protein